VIGVPHRVLTVQSWVPAFARGQAPTHRAQGSGRQTASGATRICQPAEHASAPSPLRTKP
jgi:hypothetical protein